MSRVLAVKEPVTPDALALGVEPAQRAKKGFAPAMSTCVSDLMEVVLAAAPGARGWARWTPIVRFFKDGGPFMYVNIFWLACAIAVVVERVVTLMFRYNLNAPPFMEQITKLVLTGNVDRAVKLCGAAPNAPLAKVIRAGLTRANRGEMEVAKAVEEAILEYTPHDPVAHPLALVAREHRDPGGPPRHHRRPHRHLPVARQRARGPEAGASSPTASRRR